jgi:hypothetical protein
MYCHVYYAYQIYTYTMKYQLILLLLLISAETFSQIQFGAVKKVKKNIRYIEVSPGVVWPQMLEKQNLPLYGLSAPLPAFSIGLAYREQFTKQLSVAPQFTYYRNNVYLSGLDSSMFSANYFSFQLPLDFEFVINNYRSRTSYIMVLFGGPYVALKTKARYRANYHDQAVGFEAVKPLDYGAEAGAGIRIPYFQENSRMNISIRASYFYGIDPLLEAVPSTEFSGVASSFMELSKGQVFNRGFRFSLTAEFCLNEWYLTTFTAGGNSRSTYDRYVIIKNRQ